MASNLWRPLRRVSSSWPLTAALGKVNTELRKKNLLETIVKDQDVDVHRQSWLHLQSKHESELAKSKERQIKKLDNLKAKHEAEEKKKTPQYSDLSGTQLNLLLGKNLNYVVSVENIPHGLFIVSCEKTSLRLPSKEAQNLREEKAGVLKSANIPKPNITKLEREILNQLRKDKNIIMGAQKGIREALLSLQRMKTKKR